MTRKAKLVVECRNSEAVIRNATTGETVVVKGFGSMKGQFAVNPEIDLTKPIAEQVLRPGRARTKRRSTDAPAA